MLKSDMPKSYKERICNMLIRTAQDVQKMWKQCHLNFSSGRRNLARLGGSMLRVSEEPILSKQYVARSPPLA